MKTGSYLVCTIIEHLSNVDLWSIGINEVLHALSQGLESHSFALVKCSSQPEVVTMTDNLTKTRLTTLLHSKKHITFSLNIGTDTFRMHFFDIPRQQIKTDECNTIQVVLKMISKALQMRQLSKERIIETQIINRLNLNVTTALDENKIVTNLETAARKMLGLKDIYLFYIINDAVVGSATSLQLSQIPKTIYKKLFSINQIFAIKTDSSIFTKQDRKDRKKTTLTFIPFTIKNELRGFFIIFKDILQHNHTFGITRLRFLANQAALAIERIDLFRALNRALKESHGIQDLIKIMLSSLDLSSMFNEILQRAQKILGFNRILFSLRDPEHDHFVRVAGVGISKAKLKTAKSVHPPCSAIEGLFLNRYRISNSYYIPSREVRKIRTKINSYELYTPTHYRARLAQVWDPGDIFISPVYSKSRELVALLSLDKPINNLVPTLDQVRLLETFGDFFGMAIENAQLFERIENLSNTDELTGILNYRFLREHIQQLINEHVTPITLVLIDLDGFKNFNDRYGHVYGDEVLKTFAQNLVKATGKRGRVVRYGGDEFIILFPQKTLTQVHRTMITIKRYITKHITTTRAASIKYTYGTASYPRHADNLGSLIDHADHILYSKKSKKTR